MRNIVIDYVVYQVPGNICDELNKLNEQLNDRELSDGQWKAISDLVLEKLDAIRENCNSMIEINAIYHKAFYE